MQIWRDFTAIGPICLRWRLETWSGAVALEFLASLIVEQTNCRGQGGGAFAHSDPSFLLSCCGFATGVSCCIVTD